MSKVQCQQTEPGGNGHDFRLLTLDVGLPLSPEGWRYLAARLWANGDEAHAVYAHGRAQELEAGMQFGNQELRSGTKISVS